MILKLCNKCKKPISSTEKYCSKCIEIVNKQEKEYKTIRNSKYNKTRDIKYKHIIIRTVTVWSRGILKKWRKKRNPKTTNHYRFRLEIIKRKETFRCSI